MWSFNYLYTYGKNQPDPDHVTIEENAPTKNVFDVVTDWIKWGVTYPFVVAHGIGNIILLAYYKEFHTPTMMNIYSANSINYMPIPGSANFHIVSSPEIMQAVCKYDRNHTVGLFQGKQAASVLHPLLEDLFEKKVEDNDFLLTCFSNATHLLRTPILDMIGPKNSSWIQLKLQEIVNEVMIFLKKREINGVVTINANEITEMFTVRVIAKILFEYDCQEDDYPKIQHNVGILVKHQLIRKKPCGRASQEQIDNYQNALQNIRKVIESSKGFNDSLRIPELSDLQRKGLILLLYIGGGEPPSSLLQYMFWRLGQNPEYQQEISIELETSVSIWKDRPKMEAFIAECLRMFAPGDNFSRFAHRDLNFVFHTKNKCEYKYLIRKGDGILCSPHLAGRNPHTFADPNKFKPNRFLNQDIKASNSHPLKNIRKWKPFSEGKHFCPGKSLALHEFQFLPTAIIKEYTIFSFPEKDELQVKGLPTTKEIAEPIKLILKRK